MDKKKEFVGSVGVKPVFNELVKKCSGALAAVSSAVLLFAVQGENPEGLVVQLMLAMHAFAIPCLIGCSIFFGLFSVFERVSVRTEVLLDRLFHAGFIVSIAGYLMLVWMFSRWLFLALFCGMVFTAYLIVEITREAGSPHMKRAE